ncbi:hypothetical protein C8J56DRAFT_980571 [Mycena floridula]|nr:hypothetical protein C8J56DRAFT_980571 [Mycena floridula]
MSFILDDSDPSVKYSIGDWNTGGVDEEFKSTTHGTTAANAFATIPFSGTYIEVYGTIAPQGVGHPDPVTTYTIDKGPATSFAPVTTNTSATLHQTRFFTSPTLPDGNHTLVVQSTVQGGQVWLDFFEFTPSPVTTTVTVTTTPTGSSNSGTSVNDNSTSASTKSSPQVGAIVGAALGSVAVTLLFCFILFFCWKRQRSGRDYDTRSQFMHESVSSPAMSYTAFAPQHTPVAASGQPFVPDYGNGYQSPPVNPSYTPASNPTYSPPSNPSYVPQAAVNPRSEKSYRVERERNIPPSYAYDGISQ